MMLKTLVAALIAAGSLAAQAATVSLSGTGSAAVGQTFSLDVLLLQPFDGERAGDELLAFGMDLSFDASLLRLVGVSVAPGWSDDSGFTGVVLSGSAFPGVADAGQASLALATLSFEVLGAGATSISVSGDSATSFDHGLLYLMAPTLDVQATHALALAVPEPGSYAMMLAGLGLLSLAVRRRA